MTAPRWRVLTLVTFVLWLTIDLVRATGPLISELFDIGVTVAAGAAVAAYVGGACLATVFEAVGRRTSLGLTVMILAIAVVALRIATPALEGRTLVAVGLGTLSLAMALLVTSVRAAVGAGGGPGLLGASSLGVIAAVVEQGLLHTWDAVWRADWQGWAFTAFVALGVLLSAWRARSPLEGGESPSPRPSGLWAYGLWLSLVVFAFGNLAFLASQQQAHLTVALVTTSVGLAFGVYASVRHPNPTATGTGWVAALAGVSLAVALYVPGLAAVAALPVATAATTYLASKTVRRVIDSPSRPAWRTGLRGLGANAALGLLALLPFMLVQLDYDMPLGFPHLLAMMGALVAIAVGAILVSHRQRQAGTLETVSSGHARRAAFGALVSMLAGAVLLLTFNTGAGGSGSPPAELRVASWNVHYGVTPGLSGGPRVDLESLADEMRELDADVIVVQEMTRGWILAGGADMLQYLADALQMDYAYVGAHDEQFGNAILSRYELSDVTSTPLPYGAGPQRRSALSATITTQQGPVQVTVTHLQHKQDSQTRVQQVEALLAWLPEAPAQLVAGDFNDVPTSAAVLGMLADGFESVQDGLGTEADTYVGPDFQARIDYIFTRGLTLDDFVLGDSPLSDHLSLAVTVSLP